MNVSSQQVTISFTTLNINSISSSSGVFVSSVNYSIGWSSHSKTNNGLGKFANTSVINCIGTVHDNDVIDSPIDDSDQFTIHTGNQDKPTNTVINFSEINVNALTNNSTISVGDIEQTGWSSHSKTNVGEGENQGINVSKGISAVIQDNDSIDAPIRNSIQLQTKLSED
ncbi:hypothetical protein [Paenibacillus aestuarii]|uniref:Spore germination protein n=1 Tax=Paenibacillus aestuarii TaxID=516965 RepID=A0ABW0KCR7_9BACL|nr:hypothetical protein [Paenibacillus aestuarii]